MAHLDPGDGLAVPGLGQERGRRREAHDRRGGQLARRRLGEVAVGGQHLLGPLRAPDDQAAGDDRADLVQAEAEPGDHPEVAAATPQRPEQLGVLLAVGDADLAVGGDDLDLGEVVDRPAEAAGQIAKAAAQGQAGHAGLGHEAEHRGQPVRLGGLVDVAEQAARPDVGEPGLGVDDDLAHAGQVEGQAARRHGGSGDVVAPALDAEQQPVVAGEPDRGGDVVRRGRLEDQGGEPGRHAVPDRDGIVPTLVAGRQQPALNPRVQVLQLLGGQLVVSAVKSGDARWCR